jgi:hypothetical protein
MLTLSALYADALAVVGLYNPAGAPAFMRDRALGDINGALQLMQLAGEDFYSREETTITIPADSISVTLDASIQRVLEPVTLEFGGALIALTTRSQFQDFGALYMGTIAPLVAGTPMAYFIEGTRSGMADSVSLRLYVVPTPEEPATLILPVIKAALTYTVADLADSSLIPPVPHKYHESILRPLVRYGMTTSSFYSESDAGRLPDLRSDYQRALSLLGMAAPAMPAPPAAALAGGSTQAGGQG